MNQGTVKWFNKKKNYGFIESDEQEEIFFHGSNIADHGFFGLTSNDRVSYELKEMRNGLQAVRVKVLS
jgi:CspA family cold shock protein